MQDLTPIPRGAPGNKLALRRGFTGRPRPRNESARFPQTAIVSLRCPQAPRKHPDPRVRHGQESRKAALSRELSRLLVPVRSRKISRGFHSFQLDTRWRGPLRSSGDTLSSDTEMLLSYLSNGRRTRWCERLATVTAESSDYGVNLRTVQNLFFEQLLRNFMEQTKVSL